MLVFVNYAYFSKNCRIISSIFLTLLVKTPQKLCNKLVNGKHFYPIYNWNLF